MTIRIEKDAQGRDVIWSEIGGKAVPLPVPTIYVRASDGHVFTIEGSGLPQRLRPHEPEMVEYWLREKGVKIEPNIFAGEPSLGEKKSAPEISATDEKD